MRTVNQSKIWISHFSILLKVRISKKLKTVGNIFSTSDYENVGELM